MLSRPAVGVNQFQAILICALIMKQTIYSVWGVAILVAAPVYAQTSYPMLMGLKPVAAQVGKTSEHTVMSRYSMWGAYQVLVTGEGVTGEVVHPEKPKDGKIPSLTNLKVKFKVAAGAKPGVRDFRVATPQGVSTIGQLVIARDAVVVEKEKNNTAEVAQEITVPSTLCGGIEAGEDVDFFKFKVDAGQALSFHVRSQRLQDRIHDLQSHVDPIMTLRNSAGSTLAASDNHFYGDPFLYHKFEQAGEYMLEIRDVRYKGNGYWQYAVEISDKPFISNVFPMAVARESETNLKMVGFGLPENATTLLKVSTEEPFGRQWLSLNLGETPHPVAPVVVTDLPMFVENDGDNNSAAGAQTVAIPAGINGVVNQESDIDCFNFAAKKGERYTFEVIARRHQSGLDSHLRILDDKGKQKAQNDDLRLGKRGFADSWIENWAVPADGNYTIEIRDVHLRGGADFVYFIKATRADPYFELFADTDKTPLSPGTNDVLFVRVVRKNGFTGEVQLHVDGLPPGVTADCGRILAGKGQDGCIIFHAADDATLAASNITISGTATHEVKDSDPIPLTSTALIYQETYQPGGGRGHWPVDTHTVSIGAPSDIRSFKTSETEITLKPGESKKIEVEFERAKGFDKNVTLDVRYRHLNGVYGSSLPEGITLDGNNSKTLINGKESKGYITLKASDKAPPVERQQIPIMGHVSINFVMKATYCGKPIFVTIQQP